MVKDIFREIKQKWFQFLAIAIITMLGVGFFIGIQVTGYDMRQTADLYMEESHVMDLQLHHSLGLDTDMIKELEKVIDGEIYGVYDGDTYLSNENFDNVVKVIEYNQKTKNDLRLIEGRLPQTKGETVVDAVMKDAHRLTIGSKLKVHEGDIFKEQEIEVVGFVESTLYMNLERGQSRLGSGGVSGFIYPIELEKEIDVYTSARIKLKNEKDLEKVKIKIESIEMELSNDRFERLIQPDKEKLANAQKELDDKTLEANAKFRDGEQKILANEIKLKDSYEELESGLLEIAQSPLSGENLQEQHATAQRLFEDQKGQAEKKFAAAYQEANEQENPIIKEQMLLAIKEEEQAVNEEFAKASLGLKQLKEGIDKYNQGLKELEAAKLTLQTNRSQANQEIGEAQIKIDEGYEKIAQTSRGKMYLQDREDVLIGYREFYQDSDRIEAIGKVFPLIFFGVAILVTLSTVSRMIDESRMQMGVYKALGYSSLVSALKFVGFTGIAWLLGSVAGLGIGFYMIPKLIYNAYRIMYQTPELHDGLVMSYAWLPLFVSFMSSVGVAFVKSMSVSRNKTAHLLRPPMPKDGQRIFLEHLTIIWERLSFLYKVSLRNLFRNKTRFLMTIAGIGGSFGLLITGFGLKHSIYSIVDKQFDSIIQYDGMVIYDEGAQYNHDLFDDSIDLASKTVKVNNNDVSLYISDDMNKLSEYIKFEDRKTKQKIEVSEDKVVVTEKLALLNNLQVGDDISFTYNEKVYEVEIGDIVENYVFHYIYMPKKIHKEISKQDVKNNVTLFKSTQDQELMNTTLFENDKVLAVNHLKDMRSTYKDMMGNFDIVIYVIVGAAFALELIVLLNLITMNLSERYKEMATLKVLGFYPKELALYLLRENIILTFVSLFFGAFFGKYLHQFVIINAEIDAVMFNRELLWTSYMFAAVLTLSLSIIINLLMAKKADKVNMSEALKTFDA
ncbi:ABC transporter permease [Erysipelothrix urinaevulpis]|uniref:ABC transporter permease n=1 Tax=Erysipelothrix urinaevulpis TaxID=2683717 RepID=UPI00135B5C33|nr:ABC transporter permease [Erysipelothrix urinaevulpis]